MLGYGDTQSSGDPYSVLTAGGQHCPELLLCKYRRRYVGSGGTNGPDADTESQRCQVLEMLGGAWCGPDGCGDPAELLPKMLHMVGYDPGVVK